MNPQEIEAIQKELGNDSLMGQSLDALIRDTDKYMALGLRL
ncbi:hypothetical protein [Leucothrix pacifica]|nr:hypothetical protein [Leucothrix pacifica]